MPRRSSSSRSELTHDIHTYGINIDTRELFLHGAFDAEEPGVDFRMSIQFEKNIRILESLNKKPILVHLHTVGGYWHDGMAIYDTIKTCSSSVTILCYASAESMSSIIPQAADYRVMMPNAQFMIHYGSCGHHTNYLSHLSDAENNKRITKLMFDIYVTRCKNGEKFKNWSDNKVFNFLEREMQRKQEVYLTARETVEWGFADAVLGDEGYESIDCIKSSN